VCVSGERLVGVIGKRWDAKYRRSCKRDTGKMRHIDRTAGDGLMIVTICSVVQISRMPRGGQSTYSSAALLERFPNENQS
jgi:hypothetical protein